MRGGLKGVPASGTETKKTVSILVSLWLLSVICATKHSGAESADLGTAFLGAALIGWTVVFLGTLLTAVANLAVLHIVLKVVRGRGLSREAFRRATVVLMYPLLAFFFLSPENPFVSEIYTD